MCDNKQNVSDYYYEITYQSFFHDDYQLDAKAQTLSWTGEYR